MDKQYYKEYYEIERNHWWFKARSEILSSFICHQIARERPLRILNVGVATGASSVMLKAFGEVSSLEYEQDCIDFIKEIVPISVIQGSILELPYADCSFDLVCAFDVIEHVENDELAVQELVRVCRKGGSVLVTVPALMSLWSEHDEINHHFRRYRLKAFKQLFTVKEGEIVFSTYFNTLLFIPIFIARKISSVVRDRNKKVQSDFEKYKSGLGSKILYGILKTERYFLNSSVSLPIGVSALLYWRKNDP
jgi:SAM-dependent methyltransferase